MMHRNAMGPYICEACDLTMCLECFALHQKRFKNHASFTLQEKAKQILKKYEEQQGIGVAAASAKTEKLLNELHDISRNAETLLEKLNEIVKTWTKKAMVNALEYKEQAKRNYEERHKVDLKVDEIKEMIKNGKYWNIYIEDMVTQSKILKTGETMRIPNIGEICDISSLRKQILGAINSVFVGFCDPEEPDLEYNEEQKRIPIKISEQNEKQTKNEIQENSSRLAFQRKTTRNQPEEEAMNFLLSPALAETDFINLSNMAFGDRVVSTLISALNTFKNINGFYLSFFA